MTPVAVSDQSDSNIPALPTDSEVISEDAYLDLAYQIQRAARLQNSTVGNGVLSISSTEQLGESETTGSNGAVEQSLPLTAPAVPEPVVVRELTQTDRLNNQLINAFLSRINSTQPDVSQDNSDDVNEFAEKEEDIPSTNR